MKLIKLNRINSKRILTYNSITAILLIVANYFVTLILFGLGYLVADELCIVINNLNTI